MRDITRSNFGLIIAYLLPGFVGLWGLSFFSETVQSWLAASAQDGPTVGGFLYAVLGSLAAGLTVSAIRWAVIDGIHHETGLPKPKWRFSSLQRNFDAFEGLVENHYRYYQAYANLLVALVLAYGAARAVGGVPWGGWGDLAFLLLAAILFLGSRDTLRKYYARTEQLLGQDRTCIQSSAVESDDASPRSARDAAIDRQYD